MEDVCLVKIGRSDHKFEWLIGSVYMNCKGVRKEDNILKLEYIKAVVWRALDDGLGIMIGGDMNAHIWELDGCENENGRRMKQNMNEIGLQISPHTLMQNHFDGEIPKTSNSTFGNCSGEGKNCPILLIHY